jgi:two-component system NtrC family sensor kinase
LPLRTLSTRIAVPAGFFGLISMGLLSAMLIRSQPEQVLAEVVRGSESIAGAIGLSIDREMLLNHREGVSQMLEAVGSRDGIEGIRLFDKEGRITYSSRPGEVGQIVDKRAEPCSSCHSVTNPGQVLEPKHLSRTYTNAAGQRILSTIHVIRNQPGCQGARCHVSPAQQSVLGVLDVSMTLEPAEARLAASTRGALIFSGVAVVLITAALFLIIWWSVRKPINRMVAATRRVAGGDPSVKVPRGAAREISILAGAFNEAVESLNSSNRHLEEWVGTLEQRVAEKAVELRDAQFQVVRAEKLSSVGLVAAGIAHELNSPLMAILTYSHLVQRSVPQDSQAHEDLRMIEQQANRSAAIIRQLLDYSRKQEESPVTEPCSVGQVIAGAEDLLKVELQNADVHVTVSVPDDLPEVEAQPSQLMQVFVNLMMNALQAMPDGGELTIEADTVARSAYVEPGLPPHAGTQLVRIAFRDTGVGISDKDLPKVFDPFFTTKPVGQGSGLGLSVSQGMIRGYRGTILVESDGKTGTVFTVLLPVPVPVEAMASA